MRHVMQKYIKINSLPGLFHFIIVVYSIDMIFTLYIHRRMTSKLTFIRFDSVFFILFLLSIQWTENDSLGLRVIESNIIKNSKRCKIHCGHMQIRKFPLKFKMINCALILYLFWSMNNFKYIDIQHNIYALKIGFLCFALNSRSSNNFLSVFVWIKLEMLIPKLMLNFIVHPIVASSHKNEK